MVVDAGAVAGLVAALAELGVTACAASLLRCRTLRLDTAWGPLDVFVADRPPSSRVDVGGVPVAVLKR